MCCRNLDDCKIVTHCTSVKPDRKNGADFLNKLCVSGVNANGSGCGTEVEVSKMTAGMVEDLW